MSNTAMGREPLQIVEIDQPLCVNTYGTAPCTAAVGVTGPDKCFNTRKTCQDPLNYDQTESVQTLRFAKPTATLPKDVYIIPSLVSVSTSATEINVGGGDRDKKALGARASATITFLDHPHSDRVVDPYRPDRAYDPIERSTFWSKWLARNPYYSNRIIRVKDGYVGDDISTMTTRTYLIEDINGPDSRGRVTIKAKDVLSLADDKKAQAPAVSLGELIADITDADTTLRVTGAEESEYPAPGVVRIGSEVIEYTATSTISATEINLTGATRGARGTEASGHDAEDRVQLCLDVVNENVVDLTKRLLEDFASIDPAFIPFADWTAERDVWLLPFNVSSLITEPTGVNKLLGELTEQCLYYIWWDERAQEIKLVSIRPTIEVPTFVNDTEDIVADSFQIMRKSKQRVSQIWTFFGQIDPTEELDKEDNFRRVRIQADLDKETNEQYGEQAIRKIYSRWLSTDAQIINLNTRMLARYKETPLYATLSLDAKDRDAWTGDVLNITTKSIVDQFGEPLSGLWQIIKADEIESGHMVKYELQNFEFLGNQASFWAPAATNEWTAANEDEKDTYLYWSDENGLMSDGTPGPSWQ